MNTPLRIFPSYERDGNEELVCPVKTDLKSAAMATKRRT